VSLTLVILCLAAVAVVAALVSGIVRVMVPLLDRLASRLAPRHRARLWLTLSGLPLAVGLLAVAVSFLPALGIGHDHCVAHDPHHPHLCLNHLGSAPGILVILVAGLVAARGLLAMIELVRQLRLSRRTSRSLAQVSEQQDGTLVFPSDEPQAFALGALWPSVHVSRGLLALERDIVDAVLAHERVHVRHRDLLWRAVGPLLAVGHWPAVATALRTRLVIAQELAADAEAAAALPEGRLKLAEALVVLAKLGRAPAPGLSFTHGDLRARVDALLEGDAAHPAWPLRLLASAGLLVPVVVGVFHDTIHHGLETLLGVLS
jgi:hypothetical protein